MNNRIRLWWLLAGGLTFRGVIAMLLPPGFDEAYYFLYVLHLDWSYFDHPVMVALTTGLGVWITGIVSPLTIRLGALGLFTVSLWCLYKTGQQLFSERAGWLTCAIASLSPLFFLTCGTLTAPDNGLIFFWSVALYLCAGEFFSETRRPYQPSSRLVWIAFTIGLACLSKYHGFLLGLSLVVFCASSPRHRRIFRARWFWLGALVYVLTLFPLLYWNSQHEWISFRFQLADRFEEDNAGFSLLNFLGMFLAQMGLVFPSIGFPLWWTTLKTAWNLKKTWKVSSASQSCEQAKIAFLLWAGLPVAAGFTLLSGFTHTFPAWPLPGLWSLSLLLGKAAATWPHRLVERWLKITGGIVLLTLLLSLTHVTWGTLQKPSRYALFGGIVSPQQDPSTALIDVVQLRQQLSQSPEFRAAVKSIDLIITPEYWLSGYIAMALPDFSNVPVYSFTPDPRGHAFWFDSQNWLGRDALFVSFTQIPQSQGIAEIAPYFESVTPLTAVSLQRGNALTETFYWYEAKRLLRPYPYPYG